VQADKSKNSDKEKQLANQRDIIKKVIDWLREEGLEPQEITHLRKDACYYGVVISNEAEKTEQREKQRRKAFHILFPIVRLDSLSISEVIILDLPSQKSYPFDSKIKMNFLLHIVIIVCSACLRGQNRISNLTSFYSGNFN